MFVIGLGENEASLSPIEQRFEPLAMRAQIELVLLHSLSVEYPQGTAKWLNIRSWCGRHYHLRFPGVDDMTVDSSPNGDKVQAGLQRLARRVYGRSVGLVLGGGGAKGFSHLGVIKVMHSKEMAVDYIGGVRACSMTSAHSLFLPDHHCLDLHR